MSKPEGDPSSGISLEDVLRLTKRHPACRRREAQPGSIPFRPIPCEKRQHAQLLLPDLWVGEVLSPASALRARRKRPCRRAGERGYQSDVDWHVPLSV